jgi:hypothetical protein
VKAGKIVKVFKKGSKAAKGRKKDGAASKWPSGVRIGILGHANSGKSVYFTVLNEECKVAKKLQIAVSDTATAGQLLAHYRNIWGIGTTSDVGTHVDLRGEKKFPEPTRGDKVFLFNAILDRSDKVPVVTLDYDGRAVSISEQSDLKEKLADFMAGCDGLLIFYDPKMLKAELQTQEQAAAFTNVLESIAPLNRRLPIPVGLVVTKADILAGFTGEEQTVLVGPEHENWFSKDFEIFFERVLESAKVRSNDAWAGTVRDILVKLKDFLRVVVGRTLNFQVFFVSCTGKTPEKIGTDVGRSIYKPPDKIQPIGVKEPFYWLLRAVMKNRGIKRMRFVTKWAALLSLVWVVVFSLPFLYHFSFVLPRVTANEDRIRDSQRERAGTLAGMSQQQIRRIIDPYRAYERKWVVNWFYAPFAQVSQQIQARYRRLENVDVENVLDSYIQQFAGIAADSARWPNKKVGDTVFAEDDNSQQFVRLVAQVDSLRISEEDVQLAARKERTQWLMNMFAAAILNPEQSSEIRNKIALEVEQVEKRQDVKLSSPEKGLLATLKAQRQQEEEVVEAKKTSTELEDFLATVNDDDDPKFRLETVPRKLRQALPSLQGDPANQPLIQKINNYLSQMKRFTSRRKYVFKLADAPEGYHAHVMVREGSKDTGWRQGKQLWPGVQVDSFRWRIGDEIVIALDGPHSAGNEETWGERSPLKRELKGDFALFELENSIEIGAGKSVRFSLEDNLKDLLPRIE